MTAAGMPKHIIDLVIAEQGYDGPRIWAQAEPDGSSDLCVSVTTEERDTVGAYVKREAGTAAPGDPQWVLTHILGWELTDGESVILEELTHERERRAALPAVTPRARAAACPDVVTVLTDFLRAPVCAVPKRGVAYQPPLAGWHEVATYHGDKFEMVEAFGPWETVELLLLGYYTQLYHQHGAADSRIGFSLRDAAAYCGLHVPPGKGLGGTQRARLLLATDRHQYTGFKYTRKTAAGTDAVDFSCLQWKWIREIDNEAGDGWGYVTLTEPFEKVIRGDNLTHLADPVFRAIAARNNLAALLWAHLQTQSHHRFPYLVFPDGTARANPTIAEALRLDHRTARRKVVADLRQCCRDIEAEHTGAKLAVVQPAGKRRSGVYHLVVDNLPQGRPLRYGGTAIEVRNDGDRGTEGRPLRYGTALVVGDEAPARADNPAGLDAAPSSSTSSRSSSQILKDTGNGFPASESEQPIDHNEDAEGQGKRLEAKACPAADIVAHMFGTPDRLADFVSLIGGDERLVDALALTVCRQFQNASGGAVCRGNETGNGIDAAEHLVDGGEVEWCPAFDAAHEVALKIANYLSKREQVKGSPAKYIRACMKRAADDPTEMMGRTRDESKAAYRAMCSLNPAGAKAQADLATKYTPKGIDD